MKSRKILSTLLYVAILFLLFSWMTGGFAKNSNAIPYSQVLDLFQSEQVESFTVNGSTLSMTLYSPYDGSNTVSTGLADPEGTVRKSLRHRAGTPPLRNLFSSCVQLHLPPSQSRILSQSPAAG